MMVLNSTLRNFMVLNSFLNKSFIKKDIMKRNVGTIDKAVRLVLAAILITLNLTGTVTGTLSIVLWVVTASMLFTSIFSFCPVYTLIGVNTCPAKEK
jgi:hypothetical protein